MSKDGSREMLIDAIIGRGFRTIRFACKMSKKGLAEFTGDQWNEEWTWKRDALQKLSIVELEKLYYGQEGAEDE